VRRVAVPLALLVLAVSSACSHEPTATDPPQNTTMPMTLWRTEVWHDLAVDVPDDWGWGSAPIDIGLDGASLCGGPDPDADRPYVGRPIATSDACIAADQLGTPAVPHVWLGPPIEPGTVELGEGWVQDTIEAEGTTLTVTSDDARLRREILESARAVTDCVSSLDELPDEQPMPTEGITTVESARLCAYRLEDDAWRLTYAESLGRAEGQRLKEAIFAGQQGHPDPCPGSRDAVIVTFTGFGPYGDIGLELGALVDPSCHTTTTAGTTAPLPDRVLELWRETGLWAVLSELVGPMG